MASNSAVQSLMDQPVASISVTSLSMVAEALKDYATASQLVTSERSVCVEVMSRMLAIANDGSKNTAVRAASLEVLYWISRVQDDAFRQKDLYNVVIQLNASFDELLEQEAESFTAQREMLTVLLQRCTGYVRLHAGDLLHQLCGGVEERLVTMLMSILRHRSYEWQLLQATMRCLYELSTPTTYFTAGEDPKAAMQTTSVSAFQGKMASLLKQCGREQVLPTLFHELTERWQLSAENRNSTGGTEGLGALASPATLMSVKALSPMQKYELLQWAVMLRYVSVFINNLVEFNADQQQAASAFQQSLLSTTQGQSFVAQVVIPYVMATLHAWERARANEEVSDSASNSAYLNSSVATLRLVRLTLFKQPTSVQLTATLLNALTALVQQATRLEPLLRTEYAGMLCLIYVVECLCNINARSMTSPVNLAGSLDVLLTVIAEDKNPLKPGARVNAAQGFAICFNKEDSPYCVLANESVDLIHEKFAKEEQELREDAAAYEAMERLEEQLDSLQALIMQVALAQLLSEVAAASMLFGAPPPRRAVGTGAEARMIEGSSESPNAAGKKKKKKHPAEYCCQLTGKLMKEPVTLKNGHHFELDALQDVIDKVGHIDPISSESIDEDIEVDTALQQEIAKYKIAKAASK